MADHLDAPGLKSPGMDASIDITDVYAFQKPGDAHKSILILNVNPLAPTLAPSFQHNAVYELLVDNNGDAVPDVAFKFMFSDLQNSRQSATVHMATGHQANVRAPGGKVLFADAPVSLGNTPQVSEHDDFKFFAGLRSDPFFFDLLGFLNSFKFTGADFFIDKNVSGIALEMPNSALGPNSQVGIWARTLKQQQGDWQQIDRMGRPAINTVFNHGADKNTFNQIEPTRDRALFLDKFVNTLESFGHSANEATAIANILLPDILAFDSSSAAGFLNGRKLTDDVIDIELNLVTNGQVTTDKVGPHTDYLAAFPFLGTPH